MAVAEEGGRFVQDYVIDDDIGENCHNARMKFEGSTWYEASVIKCKSIGEAEEQMARSLVIGSIMATPLAIAKDRDSDEGGYLLFVEKLYRLEGKKCMWKFKNGKSIEDDNPTKMWKIVKGGVCIGFSNYYRSIFLQVALGLLTMHSNGYRYGNSCFRVLYGVDGKPRLYDLNVTTRTNRITLKQDFFYFKSFLLRCIKLMPLPDDVGPPCTYQGLRVPHDVKCYMELITTVRGPPSEYSKWLYNAPIFWRANQKALFIGIMSRFIMEDPATCRTWFKFQGIQNDWGTQRVVNGVDPKSTLSKVYNHVDKQGQRKIIYGEVCGSAVYARNFLEHSDLGTVTFDRLEEVFPELISGIYKDLVEAITKGPYKEKLLIQDDSGPNISVEKFLWREPSIFRVYDV